MKGLSVSRVAVQPFLEVWEESSPDNEIEPLHNLNTCAKALVSVMTTHKQEKSGVVGRNNGSGKGVLPV